MTEKHEWLVVALTNPIDKSLLLKWERNFVHVGAYSHRDSSGQLLLAVLVDTPDEHSAELMGKAIFDRVVNSKDVKSVDVFKQKDVSNGREADH